MNPVMAQKLEAFGVSAGMDLVAANDTVRAALDTMRRANRPVPADMREAAEALEAEVLEAQFDNLPV